MAVDDHRGDRQHVARTVHLPVCAQGVGMGKGQEGYRRILSLVPGAKYNILKANIDVSQNAQQIDALFLS